MSTLPRSWRRTTAAAAGLGAVLATYAAAPATSAPDTTAPPATSTAASTAGRPASVTTVAVPTTGARSALAASRVAAVAPRTTKDYSLVGVTWARGTGLKGVTVEVRTRTGKTWSAWQVLETDTEDDSGGAGTRQGTEPLWVGSADGVAARVRSTGTAPRDVKIDLVDPGTDPAAMRSAATSRTTASAQAVAPPAYTAMPAMFTRAQWGAKANTACDSPRYGSQTKGVIVHHTAGSNGYTKAQSAAVVRSIQAFHMNGRGWCDIGYNFLVDKYGQVFEGRSGGALYQVRGAHAGNYDVNTYAMGVSMIGNLDTVAPSSAMKNSVVKLIGWRLGTNYLPAGGTYAVGSKYLYRISGHRDVYLRGIRPATSTACPGKYGYAWLVSTASSGLRPLVARYVSAYSTPIKTAWKKLGTATTGAVYAGEYPLAGGHATELANGDFYAKGSLGAHFVPGPTLTELKALGGVGGLLGFPAGDKTAVGDNRYQRFENGTIYKKSGEQAYGLHGGVDEKYRELGTFSSQLGAPTSRVVSSGDLRTATFEGGTIRYDKTTGTSTVTYE